MAVFFLTFNHQDTEQTTSKGEKQLCLCILDILTYTDWLLF